MLKPHLPVLTLACAVIAGCGSSPTTPAPRPGYDGQWSGTTFQGRPITFTVSSDPKVTAITIGYNFNGCSGTHTFSDLNLDIGTPPNSGAPSLGPGFGYGSGNPESGNYIQILGNFTSNTTALGSVVFGSYAGCGTAIGLWSATRH